MEKQLLETEVYSVALTFHSYMLPVLTFVFLLSQRIISVLGELESSRRWKASLIPFCGDESGYVVVDTTSDEVCEWDMDDGLGDCLATSISSYLEKYRDQLLSGHLEYLDGVGVIEKVAAGDRRK